jgi:putative transcriptional regulator
MIRHHPAEHLLLALAAGHLDAPQALLVAVHLERCPICRAKHADLEAIGGVLLEEEKPVALDPTALTAALAAAARGATDVSGNRNRFGNIGSNLMAPSLWRPRLPGGARWPAALHRCEISRWHWIWLGMRWSRVRLPHRPAASMFLLRVGPGRRLPVHSHGGTELTQVLCGSFDDGRAVFEAGDFIEADAHVVHRPTVRSDGECVCLVYVSGRLRFDGPIGGALRRWTGG